MIAAFITMFPLALLLYGGILLEWFYKYNWGDPLRPITVKKVKVKKSKKK